MVGDDDSLEFAVDDASEFEVTAFLGNDFEPSFAECFNDLAGGV